MYELADRNFLPIAKSFRFDETVRQQSARRMFAGNRTNISGTDSEMNKRKPYFV